MQGTHADASLEPTCAFDEPAGHCVQDAVPSTSAYEPASHGTHTDAFAALCLPTAHGAHVDEPATANLPAVHVEHAVDELLPDDGLAEPAAHGVHVASISWSAYVPGGQLVHTVTLPFDSDPGAHATHVAAPAPLYDPAAHDPQADAAVLPLLGLDVPASRSVHAVRPTMSAYVPAVHCAHVDTLVAAGVLLDVPVGHDTHCDWSSDAYLPATHAAHTVALALDHHPA